MSFLLWGYLEGSCVTCVEWGTALWSQLKELWVKAFLQAWRGKAKDLRKKHILWLVSYLHRVMCFLRGM